MQEGRVVFEVDYMFSIIKQQTIFLNLFLNLLYGQEYVFNFEPYMYK